MVWFWYVYVFYVSFFVFVSIRNIVEYVCWLGNNFLRERLINRVLMWLMKSCNCEWKLNYVDKLNIGWFV